MKNETDQSVAGVGIGTRQDIASYLAPAKFGATALVGFLSSDPVSLLQHLETRGFAIRQQLLKNGAAQFFTKNRIWTRSYDVSGARVYREIDGTFLLLKLLTPEAFLFLTKENAQYLQDGLLRLIYRARTELCQLRLTSDEMKSIIEGLVTDAPGPIVVNRHVARNKRQETTVSYEAETLDELYAKAAKEEAHVHSFTFTLLDKAKRHIIVRGALCRDGRLRFFDGDFGVFWQSIVERAARQVKRKKDLLSNRARSERTGEIKPIRISFGEQIFLRQDAVRSFLHVLNTIRHGEMTIFHRNPYLHVAFTDFFDTSIFDVFVDSAESLIIVPQFGATVPSLFRFCQKIFEHYQEGVISEDDTSVRAKAL